MNTNKWIIYIVSGLFLLSSAFLIISMAYSSLENVSAKDLETKIATCKSDLEKLSREEAYFSQWKNIRAYFDRFKKDYLMDMEEFSHFRDDLVIMLNKYGLAHRGVEHKYETVFKDYLRVKVSFTVNGLYPNIKRFIHDIARKERMILINHLLLTKNKDAGTITGKFNLEVYLVR